ncbi:MAG: hypothetical protein WCS69_13510 [Ignavibacteriaceae bacterium]
MNEIWQSKRNFKPIFEKELITEHHAKTFLDFLDTNKLLIDNKIFSPIIINKVPADWNSIEESEKQIINESNGLNFDWFSKITGLIPENKIYYDSAWFSLYRIQSIAASLISAIKSGKIPFSDNPSLSKLGIFSLNKITNTKYTPSVEELSNIIAFKSLSFFFPDFPELRPEEILEVRYKLDQELSAFKHEMGIIIVENQINEYDQLRNLIQNKIQPRIDDIKLKIKSIDQSLFRNISNLVFASSGASILSHYVNLPLEAQITGAAAIVGKIATIIHENISKKNELLSESRNKGYTFLLKANKKIR